MRMSTILFIILFGSMGTAQAQMQDEQDTSDTSMETEQAAEQTDAAASPEPAAADEAAAEQSGFSRGSVVRSVFTTGIDAREPVDRLDELDTRHRSVYYFTELQDMSGQTATHRWEYDGKVMAEVEFQVGGPRWRVWSKKTLVPGWTGQWTVSVLNGAGEVISEAVLEYTKAEPPAGAQPAAESGEDAMEADEASAPSPAQPAEPPPAPSNMTTE